MINKILCIYHGNCADGFGAAWAVWKRFGDAVEFHPGAYQQDPPDVAGRDVLLVDFSYKRPVIESMAKMARTITILDHHKSAAEDLVAFNKPADIFESFDCFAELSQLFGYSNVRALFDMERSGAMITWNYFHPNTPPPRLIQHIQDRDLWQFKLPGTREIQATLFSYPYDFAVWDELMDSFDEAGGSILQDEGTAIERKHFKDIKELLKAGTMRMTIAGLEVPCANLPYTMSSDAGIQMAQGEPFAACYWDTPSGRVFSLRSADNGLDVSEIAKRYGGGGHRHAAGFTLKHGASL